MPRGSADGPLDLSGVAGGKAVKSHHVEGWEGFPLVEWLSQALGLPAALANDADTLIYRTEKLLTCLRAGSMGAYSGIQSAGCDRQTTGSPH